MWDKMKAIAVLNSRALPASHGRCGEYTRVAIEAGGVVLAHSASAKDYGSSLTAAGFMKLPGVHHQHEPGDVGIVQPIAGHPDGHIAMFDGTWWISDFKQLYGLYPGEAYRKLKPHFDIYRYPAR